MTVHLTTEAWNAARDALAPYMADVDVAPISSREVAQRMFDAAFEAPVRISTQPFESLYSAFLSVDVYRDALRMALYTFCNSDQFIADIAAYAAFVTKVPGVADPNSYPSSSELEYGRWDVDADYLTDPKMVPLTKSVRGEDVRVSVPLAWFTDRDDFKAAEIAKAKAALASQKKVKQVKAAEADKARRAKRLAQYRKLRDEFGEL
jgi:hypothetical protein